MVGAGRGRHRVVRQLLTESLVLALLGGAAGRRRYRDPESRSRVDSKRAAAGGVTLEFDGRVLAFCAVTAFVVAIAFGAAPARQATGVSLVELMMSGSRASSAHGAGLRRALAVVQIAVSVLLLCGAGLLLRTLFVLEDVDSGSRATNARRWRSAFRLRIQDFRSPTACNRGGACKFYDAVEREVSALPGVKNAGWGVRCRSAVLGRDGGPGRWRPAETGGLAAAGVLRAGQRLLLSNAGYTAASWPAFRRS